MRKQLSAALLLGSLLGLVPAAAVEAAPAQPAQAMQPSAATAGGFEPYHHKDDNHYRCWYHCKERHQKYNGGYKHRRYCWYHDRRGWYYSRCHGGPR